MTLVFTTYMFMQIFHLLASRRVNDELWIFKNIRKNISFPFIWLGLLVLQILLSQFTQDAFNVA